MKLKFFMYEFKKSIWPMIILTIFGILINVPTIISENYNNVHANPNIYNFMIFLIVTCIVTPVYEFAFLHRKRSIDNYYSLPVKRRSIIMFKFTCGYIKILLSYTITFFIGTIIISFKQSTFYMAHYFPYYFLSILLGFSLYTFVSFIYTRANSIIDGIIFIGFYIMAFAIIFGSINLLFNDLFNIDIIYSLINTTPFDSLIKISELYSMLIKYGELENIPGGYVTKNDWISYLVWGVIGTASLVGLVFSSKYDKAERAEQISNSYFGYRLYLPIASVLFLYISDLKPFEYLYNFVLLALFAGVILFLYIVYQRTLKLSLKYWLMYLGTMILGIILTSI